MIGLLGWSLYGMLTANLLIDESKISGSTDQISFVVDCDGDSDWDTDLSVHGDTTESDVEESCEHDNSQFSTEGYHLYSNEFVNENQIRSDDAVPDDRSVGHVSKPVEPLLGTTYYVDCNGDDNIDVNYDDVDSVATFDNVREECTTDTENWDQQFAGFAPSDYKVYSKDALNRVGDNARDDS